MKKAGLVCCIQLLMVLLFVSSSVKAADWRFPLGLTYVSGFEDVVGIYEDNMEAEGYYVYSADYWPVGISFQPYAEFDSGFGIGFGIGPLMIIAGDREFSDIPIGVDLRYTFIPTASTTPYIRAGVRSHSASGDYVEEGSTTGFLGGFGVEFFRNRRVNMGLEISYDSSEIELEKKKRYPYTSTRENIQPCGLMLSIFVIF